MLLLHRLARTRATSLHQIRSFASKLSNQERADALAGLRSQWGPDSWELVRRDVLSVSFCLFYYSHESIFLRFRTATPFKKHTCLLISSKRGSSWAKRLIWQRQWTIILNGSTFIIPWKWHGQLMMLVESRKRFVRVQRCVLLFSLHNHSNILAIWLGCRDGKGNGPICTQRTTWWQTNITLFFTLSKIPSKYLELSLLLHETAVPLSVTFAKIDSVMSSCVKPISQTPL